MIQNRSTCNVNSYNYFDINQSINNFCVFWILITDSLYNKRLSIDGRQLNLEVFDPCSQVQYMSPSKANPSLFIVFRTNSTILKKWSCCSRRSSCFEFYYFLISSCGLEIYSSGFFVPCLMHARPATRSKLSHWESETHVTDVFLWKDTKTTHVEEEDCTSWHHSL